MMHLGVDTGGTFTDFVLLTRDGLRIHKVLSTPRAPEQAILQGIREMGLEDAVSRGEVRITHGSTVATNAALENKGVKTAFVTNRGFRDMLTLGRQTRRELYNLTPDQPPVPVPEPLCLETGGRLSARGDLIDPLTEDDIRSLTGQIRELAPDAVAINLLFSFLDDTAEKQLANALAPICYVSRSSAVLPVAGEYERGIATWLNACLGPLVSHYLQSLQKGVSPCHLAVMQSTGGTIAADQAADYAVNMLLSGPAGGLAGASYMGALQSGSINKTRLLTFDMGGTSTDVALIHGQIQLTDEGTIGPWPVAVPQVDMHTIGAGGGSIARQDAGGLLQVGPESAGADPGPACYGKGGTEPTVTDANAFLGKLHPDYFLGGEMALDMEASKAAIQKLAQSLKLSPEAAAQGILDIANEHMARALRVISIQRGHSLADFTLCCFGGAGGLHVCDIASILQMDKAMVPVHGGVLSALGMLTALKSRQLTHALIAPLDSIDKALIRDTIAGLVDRGTRALTAEGVDDQRIRQQVRLQLRYLGQTYYLDIPWQDSIGQAREDFHQRHEARYGHRLDQPVELVNVSVTLQAPQDKISLPELTDRPTARPTARTRIYLQNQWLTCDVYERELLAAGQDIPGPALVVEKVSTTLIADGWLASVDQWGNLLLSRISL